ncbi:unnamed protein product [Cuscuta campestris]|uniref:Uncharacterized protein n=1 Tax=Cuscuta campestris TaxID=132261 RepID=A0A484LNV3_9ASTE|nr:unnamed protein product [Cuscuta campestris]
MIRRSSKAIKAMYLLSKYAIIFQLNGLRSFQKTSTTSEKRCLSLDEILMEIMDKKLSDVIPTFWYAMAREHWDVFYISKYSSLMVLLKREPKLLTIFNEVEDFQLAEETYNPAADSTLGKTVPSAYKDEEMEEKHEDPHVGNKEKKKKKKQKARWKESNREKEKDQAEVVVPQNEDENVKAGKEKKNKNRKHAEADEDEPETPSKRIEKKRKHEEPYVGSREKKKKQKAAASEDTGVEPEAEAHGKKVKEKRRDQAGAVVPQKEDENVKQRKKEKKKKKQKAAVAEDTGVEPEAEAGGKKVKLVQAVPRHDRVPPLVSLDLEGFQEASPH